MGNLNRLTKKQIIRIVELQDAENFDQAFINETRNADTYEEAYENVERRFITVFGSRRYKNYQSFRKAREYRLKSR